VTDDINVEDLSDQQLAAAAELLRARSSQGDDSSPFDSTLHRRPVERDYANANERRQDVERRFNASIAGSTLRYGGGSAQVSVQELEQYSKEILGTHAAAALAKSASKPAVRKAFQDMHPESW
jgi:hypothetical protein